MCIPRHEQRNQPRSQCRPFILRTAETCTSVLGCDTFRPKNSMLAAGGRTIKKIAVLRSTLDIQKYWLTSVEETVSVLIQSSVDAQTVAPEETVRWMLDVLSEDGTPAAGVPLKISTS